MSAYTGYLIRRERLRQNLSQEGLCRGICASSYLSKIESGVVEPGEEIIDRLFEALQIGFVRDARLIAEAERQLERFFFLIEADEPYEEQKAFFEAHRERLTHSEFALKYQVFELISTASLYSRERTLPLLAGIEPFMHCLDIRLRQWVLIVKAEYQERKEDEWAALAQAAQLGQSCLVTYKQAKCAYQWGRYSHCVELAEQAYSQAAYEGSAATMIWSSFLLGTCACNRYDMEQAKRYYDRALALTRGYRKDVSDYVHYNLGSSHLECGEDDDALRHLRMTREVEGDFLHNVLLHQKLAILCRRKGEREEGCSHLALAREWFARAAWPAQQRRTQLIGQMIRFAELTFEEAMMESPEFERVTRLLYDEAMEQFGFGFKRFYGRYLVDILKRQRRYKEALRVREEMETGGLS